MPYGYIGQNLPNQTKSNSGVFSVSDVADLEKQGKFGGSLEFIAEETFSSSSAIEFTNIKENIYNVHFLQVIATEFNGNGRVYLSNDGGTSYITSGYHEGGHYGFVNGSNGHQGGSSQGYFNDIGAGSGGRIKNQYLYIYNAGNSSKFTNATFHAFGEHPTADVFFYGGNLHPTAETINAIKIAPTSSTMTGTIKLFGIKQL